jgi:hypothetical protein
MSYYKICNNGFLISFIDKKRFHPVLFFSNFVRTRRFRALPKMFCSPDSVWSDDAYPISAWEKTSARIRAVPRRRIASPPWSDTRDPYKVFQSAGSASYPIKSIVFPPFAHFSLSVFRNKPVL